MTTFIRESRNFHWPAYVPLDQSISSYGDAQTVTPSNDYGIDEVGIEPFTTTGKVLFAAGDRATPTKFATDGAGNLASGTAKDIAASTKLLRSADGVTVSGLAALNLSMEGLYPGIPPLSGKEKILVVNTDLGDEDLTNWFAFKPSADVPDYEILATLVDSNNNNRPLTGAYGGYSGAILQRFSSEGPVEAGTDNIIFEIRDGTDTFALASGWKWLWRTNGPWPQYIATGSRVILIMRQFVGDLDDPGARPRGKRMAAAIYVGGTGNLSVQTIEGRTVAFKAVPKGTILPIYCTQVFKTGTSATDIVALYPPPGA